VISVKLREERHEMKRVVLQSPWTLCKKEWVLLVTVDKHRIEVSITYY